MLFLFASLHVIFTCLSFISYLLKFTLQKQICFSMPLSIFSFFHSHSSFYFFLPPSSLFCITSRVQHFVWMALCMCMCVSWLGVCGCIVTHITAPDVQFALQPRLNGGTDREREQEDVGVMAS